MNTAICILHLTFCMFKPQTYCMEFCSVKFVFVKNQRVVFLFCEGEEETRNINPYEESNSCNPSPRGRGGGAESFYECC